METPEQDFLKAGGDAAESRMRGSNQSGLRAHNKRAVLSLIRRNGRLAKAEIARRTGLSPQTASVIMRALEAEELVVRDQPQRGRVGQPSIPMRLNPDGAFSLGLKIGRRSVDLVLMDFVGRIRGHERVAYPYPRVREVLDFVASAEPKLRSLLSPKLDKRITGLGVALPYELWSWADEIAAPPGAMEEWRDFDIQAMLATVTDLPVNVANDATAACAAENVFGATGSADFIYFFVGAFVGGGIVMNGDLVAGRLGNAGAVGSMPVPRGEGGSAQLINFASLHLLEKMYEAEGGDALALWRGSVSWESFGPLLEAWLDRAAWGLAHAVVSACSVYDFESAVIDGRFPQNVRARLVEKTAAAIRGINQQGLSPVTVREGTIGLDAREIGSASLPFFAHYLLDHRVFLTEPE
ncbi:ROK family transcriptional regulator [Jiella sonneratiae]|uniref:ROK family transcriptional regulator n=1 Tax=Jiella sonneratiae TaxID=2816856 RepID=A0ABS3J9D7_9HYPH|nr:ROK family transcriptional regulator [Jiella sonneratiae]MBO0905171.1 ROK family transcriptional regulator [Jiella sonneratiae]